jgi:hypothetical protein
VDGFVGIELGIGVVSVLPVRGCLAKAERDEGGEKERRDMHDDGHDGDVGAVLKGG